MTITIDEIRLRAAQVDPQVRATRRDIHRHPELGFQEHRTAGLVARTLHDLQIEVETEVAKTGVIGTIQGGDGPTIALRADMDALPITEQNGFTFDSQNAGVMHACGHDAHTAMLLGASNILKSLADEGQLPGTVRLLFQPSEEGPDTEGKSGGQRLVEEGKLEGVDMLFGLHVDPTYPVGQVATRPGPMMASPTKFTITLHGRAGHAARPHETLDTIALSAQVIQAIHQVVSRKMNPVEDGVITIGTINGGTKENIIADKVVMTGTTRSFTPQVKQLLYDELDRACRIIELYGGRYELDYWPGHPPVVNDPTATETMIAASGDLLGTTQVQHSPLVMGGEDFSHLAQVAPACFLRLGTHNPTWSQVYPLHTPTFRLDENALQLGVATLVATTLRAMAQ